MQQKAALERGLVADPSTPDLAWEAGNFYLVQGETEKALREFRVVMESDPYLPSAALRLCWRVKPDIDVLLRDVVPPNVYATFLDFLVSQKETAAAAKVWTRLVATAPADAQPLVFLYIRYLVGQHERRPGAPGMATVLPVCAGCRPTSLHRKISLSTAISA